MALLLAGLGLMVGAQQPGPSHDERPPMRVGFLSNYAPFSFIGPDGRLQGFDIDVFVAICDAMGWRFESLADTMAGLQQKLRAEMIDGIGNQLLYTPQNRRIFKFIQPAYASIQLHAVQHEDDSRDFFSLDELVGKRLGVLADSGIEQRARAVLGQGVVGFAHATDTLRALSAGELDVVLEESLIADYYIEQEKLPLKVTAPFAAPVAVGLVVNKDDHGMQQRWSQAVKTVLNNGTVAKISQRWFGYDVSQPRAANSQDVKP